ncbi:MAG: HD domain-containing protein [Planctomycetota bacterium]
MGCAEKFCEAEMLARGILDSGGSVPLPYFTGHGVEHCAAVERYLDEIIWGTDRPSEYDVIPSPEEAMYLLSAAWLHDIGMMYGIFNGEEPGDLQDYREAISLRREHEFRTSTYIRDKWEDNCSWSEEEKKWLANICVYHRRHRPISEFDPFQVKTHGSKQYIRLAVLAALLRLADACLADQSRAPGPLLALYISLGMPQEALGHWKRAKLIRNVSFDHVERRIVLTGDYPPKVRFEFGEFDLGEVGEIVCRDVQDELDSVKQVLSIYPNTAFRDIEHDPHYVVALKPQGKQHCLALWPYFLSRPSSASETAAALCQVLLFAAEEGERTHTLGDGWRKTISQIMNKTQDARPFDFMIRNLRKGVERILARMPADAKSAGRLTRYLKGFSQDIRKKCDSMVNLAVKLINPEDVLVIHGYSRNIEKLLRNVWKQHRVYIVDCDNPIETETLGPNENTRITSLVHELGFNEVKFLYLPLLPRALGELRRNDTPCKLLLGTHGVLTKKNEGFLCKIGSYTLAATAKIFDTKVIVLAEGTKFLNNGESDEDVIGFEKLFSSEGCEPHPQMRGIMCPMGKMDFVPSELVDLVVTERGVERSLKSTRRGARVSKSSATGKKASRAT